MKSQEKALNGSFSLCHIYVLRPIPPLTFQDSYTAYTILLGVNVVSGTRPLESVESYQKQPADFSRNPAQKPAQGTHLQLRFDDMYARIGPTKYRTLRNIGRNHWSICQTDCLQSYKSKTFCVHPRQTYKT